MQDTGYIGFHPGSRIPNPASIGAEMAQTMINAGYLRKQDHTEGSFVHKGDPLIGNTPYPYD
jgi:hypothetical protein